MKTPLLKFYWHTRTFWIIRLGVVWFNDIKVLELSLGLLGAGVVVQVYTKDRQLDYEKKKVQATAMVKS